jgi:hypothetical protein
VRQSNQQTDAAGSGERKKAAARRGYASTVQPQSLIQPQAQQGSRTLLG